MILLFLSAILVVFCGMLFSLSFSIQGLNRAIINTPIELMYRTVKYVDDEMVFNIDQFESDILSYYDKSLTRYTKNYNVDFYYYNMEDESMCLTKTCNAVEITIECKLMMEYDFKRVMFYELRGKN